MSKFVNVQDLVDLVEKFAGFDITDDTITWVPLYENEAYHNYLEKVTYYEDWYTNYCYYITSGQFDAWKADPSNIHDYIIGEDIDLSTKQCWLGEEFCFVADEPEPDTIKPLRPARFWGPNVKSTKLIYKFAGVGDNLEVGLFNRRRQPVYWAKYGKEAVLKKYGYY